MRYSILSLLLAKIIKGERRDKRKIHFRFDYAEPNPIFVSTKIAIFLMACARNPIRGIWI
ncbi:MAG: hypothetical protein EGR14_00195 [Barnesiella intestinihominis]|nr:hypothetical protein [Barnesiella intestinihominis]